MPSRFDAAALSTAPTLRAGSGCVSGLLLSVVLRGAMRLLAVFA